MSGNKHTVQLVFYTLLPFSSALILLFCLHLMPRPVQYRSVIRFMLLRARHFIAEPSAAYGEDVPSQATQYTTAIIEVELTSQMENGQQDLLKLVRTVVKNCNASCVQNVAASPMMPYHTSSACASSGSVVNLLAEIAVGKLCV